MSFDVSPHVDESFSVIVGVIFLFRLHDTKSRTKNPGRYRKETQHVFGVRYNVRWAGQQFLDTRDGSVAQDFDECVTVRSVWLEWWLQWTAGLSSRGGFAWRLKWKAWLEWWVKVEAGTAGWGGLYQCMWYTNSNLALGHWRDPVGSLAWSKLGWLNWTSLLRVDTAGILEMFACCDCFS